MKGRPFAETGTLVGVGVGLALVILLVVQAATSGPGPAAATTTETSPTEMLGSTTGQVSVTTATSNTTSATELTPVNTSILLPANLTRVVPAVTMSYQQEFFSGKQGSYCWAGVATTNQSSTTLATVCHAAAPPTDITGLPTVAVYPNATVRFVFSDQYTEDLTASLFQSGSMDLVGSNSSAVNGFALGALPSGDYILRANASFGRSYTVDYFGIRQIESANYTEGSIRITIGSPTTQEASFTNGAESISGIESETWPLTLSSPSVITGVNLTSISIIDQAYVEFFPSYLPELGPSGATVSMLVAGAGAPSSVYSSDGVNVSMIIQATATSGSTGEVGLPMVVSGTGAGFIVLHSLASRQEVVGSAMTIPQGGFPPFDTEAIIYDPPVATNQSLPITISITGLYNSNGSLLPPSASPLIYVLPSTLNQSLIPYEPLYFALYGLTNGTTHTAPVGSYILVVDVQMGSASLTLFVPVQVIPPIPALDGPVEQMP